MYVYALYINIGEREREWERRGEREWREKQKMYAFIYRSPQAYYDSELVAMVVQTTEANEAKKK